MFCCAADRAGLTGHERTREDARLCVEVGAVLRAVVRQRRLRGLGRLPVFRLRGVKRRLQLGALLLLLFQRRQRRAALPGRVLRVPGLRGGHGQLRLFAQFPARSFQRLRGCVRPGARRIVVASLLRQPLALRPCLCAQRVELFIPPQRVFQPRDVLPPALDLRL